VACGGLSEVGRKIIAVESAVTGIGV